MKRHEKNYELWVISYECKKRKTGYKASFFIENHTIENQMVDGLQKQKV
jgi:hypothetical protein